jgi:hypothetical protein
MDSEETGVVCSSGCTENKGILLLENDLHVHRLYTIIERGSD